MFKYELGARVRIVESGEQGTVRARSDHVDMAEQYQVAYRGADGVAREDWFFGSRLIPYQDGLQGPDPMAGVELKSATGVDEALPMEAPLGGAVGSSTLADDGHF